MNENYFKQLILEELRSSLSEKRRNPEKNRKQFAEDAFKKYLDNPNAGISFVQNFTSKSKYQPGVAVNSKEREGGSRGYKLGINPKSQFRTPNGIYFYPLQFYKDDILKALADGDRIYNVFPWVPGKAAAIYFFEYDTDGVLNIGNIKYTSVAGYLDRLGEWYSKQINVEAEEFIQHLEACANERADTSLAGPSKDNLLWQATLYVSQMISNSKQSGKFAGKYDFSQYKEYMDSIVDHPPSDIINSTNTWAMIWQKVLGIHTVIDNGEGIIHENEPMQGVCFDRSKLSTLDVIDLNTTKVGSRTTVYNKLVVLVVSKNFTDRTKQVFMDIYNRVKDSLKEENLRLLLTCVQYKRFELANIIINSLQHDDLGNYHNTLYRILYELAIYKNVDLGKLILQRFADLDNYDFSELGNIMIQTAIYGNNVPVIKYIFSLGVKPSPEIIQVLNEKGYGVLAKKFSGI